MSNQTNTVFILGAGASHEAGAPLLNDFLDKAWELWKTGRVLADDEKDFRIVFSAKGQLQKILSKSKLDLNNLESVFSIFEMASYLDQFYSDPTQEGGVIHADLIIRSLKKVILVTLESEISYPIENGNLRPTQDYNKFVNLIQNLKNQASPQHKVTVITFNYDIALDVAIKWNGFECDYGFVRFFMGDNTIPIYKLHGSLNWGVDTQKQKIIPWEIGSSIFKSRTDGKLRVGQEIIRGIYKKEVSEIFLVPPTFNKTFSNDQLKSTWKYASEALGEADNLFVIGFSLPETDLFFKYLYALGSVGEDIFKRFWVFDPKPEGGEVDNKYKKLLGPGAELKYKYYPFTFKEACSIIQSEFKIRNHG